MDEDHESCNMPVRRRWVNVTNLKVLREKMYIEADFDGEHWSFPLAVRVHEDMVLLKDGLPAL